MGIRQDSHQMRKGSLQLKGKLSSLRRAFAGKSAALCGIYQDHLDAGAKGAADFLAYGENGPNDPAVMLAMKRLHDAVKPQTSRYEQVFNPTEVIEANPPSDENDPEKARIRAALDVFGDRINGTMRIESPEERYAEENKPSPD